MRLNTINIIMIAVSLSLSGCFLKPSGGKKNKRSGADQTGESPDEPSDKPDQNGPSDPSDPASNSSGTNGAQTQEADGLSTRSEVRFKPQDIMQYEIADVLALPADDLCKETGEVDCIEDVHRIALGGVDAYNGGAPAPISESMVTTPIAWERVVLSACSKRVDKDLASPSSAVIFAGIQTDNQGNLANVGAPEVTNAITMLYQRALKRPAQNYEIEAIKSLYGDALTAVKTNAAEQWATAACYVVLTNVEFVFY